MTNDHDGLILETVRMGRAGGDTSPEVSPPAFPEVSRLPHGREPKLVPATLKTH